VSDKLIDRLMTYRKSQCAVFWALGLAVKIHEKSKFESLSLEKMGSKE